MVCLEDHRAANVCVYKPEVLFSLKNLLVSFPFHLLLTQVTLFLGLHTQTTAPGQRKGGLKKLKSKSANMHWWWVLGQAGLAEGWNSGVSTALPWSQIPSGQASPAWNREQLSGASSKGWGPLSVSASPFPAYWMPSIQVQDRERAPSQPANWTMDPVCLPLLCKLAAFHL